MLPPHPPANPKRARADVRRARPVREVATAGAGDECRSSPDRTPVRPATVRLKSELRVLARR
jgi:hypothetical protein